MTSVMRSSFSSTEPLNGSRSFGGTKKLRTNVLAAEGSDEGRNGRSRKGTSSAATGSELSGWYYSVKTDLEISIQRYIGAAIRRPLRGQLSFATRRRTIEAFCEYLHSPQAQWPS